MRDVTYAVDGKEYLVRFTVHMKNLDARERAGKVRLAPWKAAALEACRAVANGNRDAAKSIIAGFPDLKIVKWGKGKAFVCDHGCDGIAPYFFVDHAN